MHTGLRGMTVHPPTIFLGNRERMSEAIARLDRLGQSGSPVVTLDRLPCAWPALIDAAVELGPFPPAQVVRYPGLRRLFSENDASAWYLTRNLLQAAAPYIAGAFDCSGFMLVEANFSLVTTAPQMLLPMQRHPHFDSTDPRFIALIAYLFAAGEGDGTAFYRHRSTGIEELEPGNVDRLVAAVRAEAAGRAGYFAPGDPGFDCIGTIFAHFGRVGIWPGRLLHSGLIPAEHNFSPDPRAGRLTLNLFLRLTSD